VDLVQIFVITKCTKFGQLILRKIIKIVATRCQNLRLKCTKFRFRFSPDPAGGAYSAPQTPELDLRGQLRGGREGKGQGGEGRGKEKGKGRGKGKGGEGVPCSDFTI